MTPAALPGALALVGSGEYTAAMREIDRDLLETVGGPRAAHVVVLPTASAREPGMPEQWNARGVAHFSALGARVTPLLLLERPDAFHPDILQTLAVADVFYVSGGNPQHLVETLRDTPAWRCIVERHAAGAVVAGCSAGAMMLGGHTIDVRSVAFGGVPRWLPALALLPWLATLPHFDRIAAFVQQEQWQAMIRSVPGGLTVLGIDEDTAVVGTNGRWHIQGRQSATLIASDGNHARFAAGDIIPLPPLASPRHAAPDSDRDERVSG